MNPLNLKITTKDNTKNIFKPETSILRLSNYKSKKYINWYPKWSLDKSLKKIIQWNKEIKYKNSLDVCKDQILEFIKF